MCAAQRADRYRPLSERRATREGRICGGGRGRGLRQPGRRTDAARRAGVRRAAGRNLRRGEYGGRGRRAAGRRNTVRGRYDAAARGLPPRHRAARGRGARLGLLRVLLCAAEHPAAASGGDLRRGAGARRRLDAALRADRRCAPLRLPRHAPRCGAPFLPDGGGEALHRHHGRPQAQHAALASDGRPGLAHRDQALSASDRGGQRAQVHGRGQGLGPLRRRASRRLLYAGRDPRRGGLCRRPRDHGDSGGGPARAHARRADGLSRAGLHGRAV